MEEIMTKFTAAVIQAGSVLLIARVLLRRRVS